jgi:hypothetical protein
MPCIHASPTALVFRRVEAAQSLDIQAALRNAAEPEPLIINHQFVILPEGP